LVSFPAILLHFRLGERPNSRPKRERDRSSHSLIAWTANL